MRAAPIVDHDDGAGVLDRVGRLALTTETSADIGPHRELGVQNLQGDTVTVPVRRGIDGRHAAEAENAFETILASELSTHAGLRASCEFVVRF
jgi:hypothetical protein